MDRNPFSQSRSVDSHRFVLGMELSSGIRRFFAPFGATLPLLGCKAFMYLNVYSAGTFRRLATGCTETIQGKGTIQFKFQKCSVDRYLRRRREHSKIKKDTSEIAERVFDFSQRSHGPVRSDRFSATRIQTPLSSIFLGL